MNAGALRPAMAGVGGGIAAWGLSVLVNRSVSASLSRPGVLRLIAADTFLIEAMAVTVIAPVAGAVLARGGRRAALIAGSAFVATSLLAALAASTRSGYPMTLVLRSHLTLAIVACGLAAFGALLGSLSRQTLDAAGAALAASVIAGAAILFGGPATADLSERAINAGLLASPTVAIVSSAEIDILRNDIFYRLSPVSHRRFSYPEWQVTALTYGTLAAGCLACIPVVARRRPRPIP